MHPIVNLSISSLRYLCKSFDSNTFNKPVMLFFLPAVPIVLALNTYPFQIKLLYIYNISWYHQRNLSLYLVFITFKLLRRFQMEYHDHPYISEHHNPDITYLQVSPELLDPSKKSVIFYTLDIHNEVEVH